MTSLASAFGIDLPTTSPLHQAALKHDGAQHAALTNVFTGRPARGIVNRVMREMGPMNGGAPRFPLATGGIAPLRAAAEARGSGTSRHSGPGRT